MKKLKMSTIVLAIFVSIIDIGFAQQFPTGTPPGGTTAAQANAGWYRGGNNNSNGTNNIFGTLWNSPIYTATNNTLRQKLNGNVTYSIAASNQPRNGYQLLGVDGPMYSGGPNELFVNFGAFSLLHLNGNNGTFTQQFGHRDWMRTGITFTDNDDMSYFGLRKVGTGTDITETAVVWADNAGSSGGPDDFVFRFTSGNNSTATLTDLAADSDADGLHIGRFAGTGQFGLGNTFGAIPTTALYIRPQSLFHMSYQFRANAASQGFGFQQITYRRPLSAGTDIIGQGEAATDGLRFGIDNVIWTPLGGTSHLNSYLRWQESSSFIIQTEDGGAANIDANERLRVTSIGALNAIYNPLMYDGLTSTTDATRISISESGATPLTRPKSLLHLGYDYGGFLGAGGFQGYRKWMDLGVLTSNNKDHVWLGLKPRDSLTTTVAIGNDRLNAVVAWGTDRLATSPTQVDNMQFIFTGHVLDANPDNAPSTSYNGLEMMRMYPATVYTHPIFDPSGAQTDSVRSYGRVGVGDFTVSGVNEEPTQKLDVVGNGRFRYLPDPAFARDSTVDKFVMVDTNGVLRWGFAPKGLSCWDINGNGIQDSIEDINGDGLWNSLDCSGVAGPMGTFGAHNGTSISTIDTTKVSLGQDLNQIGAPGQLLSTREIPMNNFNTVFTHVPGYSGNANRLGLGTSAPTAKLDITMNPTTPYPLPVGLNILIDQTASNGQVIGHKMNIYGSNSTNTGGLWGITPGTLQTQGLIVQVAGSSPAGLSHHGIQGTSFVVGPSNFNVGIAGSAGSGRHNYGGAYSATGLAGAQRNVGVSTNASGVGNSENMGILSQVSGTGTANNYGLWTQVLVNSGVNFGVYAQINNVTNPLNRAGFFAGTVQVNTTVITSDSIFKTNVNSISGSLRALASVKPVSYYMNVANYPNFGFDNKKQFGFIAQQVESVFPNLVYESIKPAEFDDQGNQTSAAVPFKSVNYTGLIPINTQAIIELNQKVDAISLSDESIKTNVQDLTGSLDKVLEMRGVSYDWDHTVHPELNLDSVNQVGFIAQEIQLIDSRLTFVADDSLLHVKYEKVVPILAEAIEELNVQVESKDSIINVLVNENSAQQNTIDDLNDRLTQLENCLSGILPFLCQLSHSAIQANTPEAQEEFRKNLNVTLSNRSAIVLDQNVPNPFAEQTVINFSIPETVKKAQIHFYDANGRFMNSVDVTERGLGSVTVFGSDLSTGIYTYSLVADGQVVATKKMMKQ